MNRFIKKYVSVDVHFQENGQMLPRTIYWEDGVRYPVDRVISIDRAAAQRAGGQGDRYFISVGGKKTAIFFEHTTDQETSSIPGRWFVEAAAPAEEPLPKE